MKRASLISLLGLGILLWAGFANATLYTFSPSPAFPAPGDFTLTFEITPDPMPPLPLVVDIGSVPGPWTLTTSGFSDPVLNFTVSNGPSSNLAIDFTLNEFLINVSDSSPDNNFGSMDYAQINIGGIDSIFTLTRLEGFEEQRTGSPERPIITAQPGTPVPEPATLALFATGLLSLVGYRWYQRRREGVPTA